MKQRFLSITAIRKCLAVSPFVSVPAIHIARGNNRWSALRERRTSLKLTCCLTFISIAIALSINPTRAIDTDRFLKLPAGIQCDDISCAEAFARAFAASDQKGWRLFAMEQGRRRAASRSEAHFIISNIIGSGSYTEGFWIVKGGDVVMTPVALPGGNTFYKITSNFENSSTTYVVPTRSPPPSTLRFVGTRSVMAEAQR